MPYSLDQKLVVAVASSALFDLSESDKIYREQGLKAYRQFQQNNIDSTLDKGVAFPFIRRLLSINRSFPDLQPIEVILLSRNSPETGLRVFRSIETHGLGITRAAFFTGQSPYQYIPAFNASLFLSANKEDVNLAIQAGFPAGVVQKTTFIDDPMDEELRIAFDFDGVLADDSAEAVYQQNHDLNEFNREENSKRISPLNPGPLNDLLMKLASFQRLEDEKQETEPGYKRKIHISIVTARSAPAHERMVNTLSSWGINADNAFFLGGINKSKVLGVLQPHIFFDDQRVHLADAEMVPCVHIPFGITNIS
jgi:5'-nucleotidase